jgi:hypothetical protein
MSLDTFLALISTGCFMVTTVVAVLSFRRTSRQIMRHLEKLSRDPHNG